MLRRAIRSLTAASPVLLLEVALTLTLLVMASSELSGLRRQDRAADNWREHLLASDQYQGPDAQIASLGGISAGAAEAELLEVPGEASRLVAFVVHGADLANDLTFWSEVQSKLGADSGVELVGYCDNEACGRAYAHRARAAFPVLAYTAYHTARVVMRADAGGRCIVLDSKLKILGSVGWMGHPSPADVAAAIAGRI